MIHQCHRILYDTKILFGIYVFINHTKMNLQQKSIVISKMFNEVYLTTHIYWLKSK